MLERKCEEESGKFKGNGDKMKEREGEREREANVGGSEKRDIDYRI